MTRRVDSCPLFDVSAVQVRSAPRSYKVSEPRQNGTINIGNMPATIRVLA
jgi:hypothetical protein